MEDNLQTTMEEETGIKPAPRHIRPSNQELDLLEDRDEFIEAFRPLDEEELALIRDVPKKPEKPETERWRLKDQPSHAPKLLRALAAVAIATAFVGIAALIQPAVQGAKTEDRGSAIEQSAGQQAAPPDAAPIAEQGAAQADPYVAPRANAFELEGDTAPIVKSTNTYGILTQAIGAFEDQGYDLAFVLHDLNSGHELVYNAGTELYPASSIKGPYTTAVYEMLVESGDASLDEISSVAEDTIHSSSDESYRKLINMCGRTCFADWLRDFGISAGSYETHENMVEWNFPHISATQLNQMWRRIYSYISGTNTEARDQLKAFLRDRDTSPMRDAIGAIYDTLGKAGWIESEGDYGATPATVDSGIVYAGNHPYAVTVISTAPADLELLSTIFAPLDRAHNDMVLGFGL